MIEVRQTAVFARWLRRLRDEGTRARVVRRIARLASGNPGDVRSIGHGVSELRLDFGPGYRIDFTRRGETVVLLLAGGTKSTQSRDIWTAVRLSNSGE